MSASTATDEEWRSTIKVFFVLRALGSAAARRHAEKLAEAIDREALDVFRVARRLESGSPRLAYVQELNIDKLATGHSKDSIIGSLRDFTKAHVNFARLDDLQEQLGRTPESWYRQGRLLLDAAMRVRNNVELYRYIDHDRLVDEAGTVAWSYLIKHIKRWQASNGEVARRLKAAGYPGVDRDLFHLKENIKKHRLRRSPRRTRKLRSR